MPKAINFSIVVNTYNRGSTLQKTLESFRWLKYNGNFEVIVVNGPSTDNSDEIIGSYKNIRVGKCDVANLSISRNIGICMAQGDVVAFIDDDAIPEPEWLTHLAGAYADPSVGAAGGFVFDHTGYNFQSKYCVVDRLGDADFSPPCPTPHHCFPKSDQIPHLLGCNSSFRRTALLEVGGFDEEFEYFLDETDLCLRIIDAGYLISQLPNAFVHHKYAPSHIRDENRVVRHRFPVIKNKIYFQHKHASEHHTADRIRLEQKNLMQSQRDDLSWCLENKLLTKEETQATELDLQRAQIIGNKRGLEGIDDNAMITSSKVEEHFGNFLKFKCIKIKNPKTIVLISQDYPPNHGGGIATFMKDLAVSLGSLGHTVHVITRCQDFNRVDFEEGVWVHNIVAKSIDLAQWAIDAEVPQHIWDWSATALEEVNRISTHRKVDVVEAPIWDCEGVAFLNNNKWPLVTNLQTTLYFWLQSNPEHTSEKHWMEKHYRPVIQLEQKIMQESAVIKSISKAIAGEIEHAYDFKFDPNKLIVSLLGITDLPHKTRLKRKKQMEVLFVGRLESRKGIDILLDSIPNLIKKLPDMHFRIVGENTLLSTNGKSYMDNFVAKNQNEPWLDRIQFDGKIGSDELLKAYNECDIFVAPSRFESFGLIFLEAMRAGKPVIGCAVGGIPEIINDHQNGLLIEPDNSDQLIDAIVELTYNKQLRDRLGKAGRKTFKNSFSALRMARESENIYETAISNFSMPPPTKQ